MGIKIYKSAKKVYIDELVEAIKRDDRLIIIDVFGSCGKL